MTSPAAKVTSPGSWVRNLLRQWGQGKDRKTNGHPKAETKPPKQKERERKKERKKGKKEKEKKSTSQHGDMRTKPGL